MTEIVEQLKSQVSTLSAAERGSGLFPAYFLETGRGRGAMAKEQKRKNLSAEESLKRMQEFAQRKEKFVAAAKTEAVYRRLTIVADPNTVIWLVDDCWHPVQKAIGTLDTSVLHGRYFIELGETGLNGVAYPLELFGDLRLTQESLEAGPACLRQPPRFADE